MKHFKKKLLLSLMSLVLAFTLVTPVLAANTSTASQEATEGINATDVIFNVDSFYSVTIPKTIILDGLTSEGDYSVSVRGDISGTESIWVIPDQTFTMQSAGKNNIDVTVTQEKIEFTYADGLRADTPVLETGTVKAKRLTAGRWSGVFYFNIGIDEPISSDEIANDPYLFGIGETKREYVVAKFNEDYSSVTVFKNGLNSDGRMMNWTNPTTPEPLPMYQHKSTLKNVIIEEGVTTIGNNAFRDLTAVTSQIELPSTLTSIGTRAFYKCSAPGALNIPNNVTSIGSSAFYSCSNLTSLTLGNSVTEIGQSCFGNCTSLKGELTLNEGLQKINSYAFSSCSKITGGLNMPSTLTYIGAFAFQSMRGLNGELILNEGLEHIGDGAFNHCQNMTNTVLNIPSTVTSIGGDTKYIVTEDSASATTPPTTFYNFGTHVFYNFATQHLKAYSVSTDNTKFKAQDGVLLSKDGKRLLAYPPSKEGSVYEIPEGVVTLDEMAFSRIINGSATEKLTTLVLPDSYVITIDDQSPNALNRANGNSLAISLYTHNTVAEIAVKESNPNYKTVDGCLYSKDGKTLYYVPIAKTGTITVQEGTTTVACGALYGFEKASEHPRLGKALTPATEIVLPASYTTVYHATLTRLNTFINLGNTVTIADGNTAFVWNNGKLTVPSGTLTVKADVDDGWMEI